MKKPWGVMLIVFCLTACSENKTKVSVKTDSINRELDTLGNKIEEKAAVVGDSVTSKFKDLKKSVKAGMDSIKQKQ